MTSGITIPAGEMAAIVQKAILDSLSEETKQTILAQALAIIMDKPVDKNSYGRQEKLPSMLEQSFAQAMRGVANEVAEELVQELKPQIALELRPMIEAIGGEYDWELGTKLFAVMLQWAKDQRESTVNRGY